MAVDLNDVRVFIPRIRRELAPGVNSTAAASGYTDDMLKDVAADAVAEIAYLGGNSFPYILSVTNASAATSGYDWEYRTDPEVPLLLHGLIAIQAAIMQLFKDLQTFKTQEKISDEGSSWEYQKSSTLYKEQISALLNRRKEMLDRLRYNNPELVPDYLVNILGQRNEFVDMAVEPFWYMDE